MNYFKKLPEELFDNILKYNNVIDIINFSKTSNENNFFVKKITDNENSQISRFYNIKSIYKLNTWINLPKKKYNFEISKEILHIYSNISSQNTHLTYYKIKQIFSNLINLIKYIDIDIKNKVMLQHYNNIIKTVIIFISQNNHIFDGEHTDNYKEKESILNIIFKLYSKKFDFLTRNDFNELESYIINMFQDILDRIIDKSQGEIERQFIINYLEGFFYYSEQYKNIDYIKEIIMDILIEMEVEYLFIIPEI